MLEGALSFAPIAADRTEQTLEAAADVAHQFDVRLVRVVHFGRLSVDGDDGLFARRVPALGRVLDGVVADTDDEVRAIEA